MKNQQSDKRRALIVTRVHLPEPTAASQRWEAVERALIEAGYDVEVLTSQYPKDKHGEDGAVHVRRWPTLRDGTGNLRGYLPYLSFDVPVFFRMLAAPRPDMVLVEPPPTTGLAARAVCSLRGLPYIWYAADTWSSGVRSMNVHPLIVKTLEWAERRAISGAEAVVAVTEGVEQRVREMGAETVTLVPNGIDTDVYTPVSRPVEDLKYPYFIYGGTASEFQGAEVFMDAFEKILESNPNVQLLFVGSGTDWKKLSKRAEEINARFTDVPRAIVRESLPPSELAPLLSGAIAALVSIVPMHSVDTPYPTKILAALACQTPVVFLGSGKAAQDIEENELGLATSYGVSEAQRAMETILDGTFTVHPEKLREWVIEHRSLTRTGAGVLGVVRAAEKSWERLRLVIATRVFPPDPGAAAARLQVLTERMAPDFRTIRVITSKPRLAAELKFADNVDLRRAPVLRASDGTVRGYLEYMSFDIPLFFRLLFGPRADVALCEPPPTTGAAVRMAGAIRRMPYVYYAGDVLGDATRASEVNPLIVKGVQILESIALRGAAKVVTANGQFAKRIKEVAKVDAEVVSSGIELPDQVEVGKLPAEWPKTDGPVFVYAGTVTEWMGATLFVKAAPQLFETYPDARIVFVGGGMGWDSLVAEVDALGDPRVMTVGFVPLDEAYKWQANATACLASLLPGAYETAYTTKALSSWSVGTPVVYAGVGPGAEDVVNFNLGILAKEADPSHVAEAMVEMADTVREQPNVFLPERLRSWVAKEHGAGSWAARVSKTLRANARRRKRYGRK